MKLGFVIPWFGMDIPGGAEAALRDLVLNINARIERQDVEVEVITTCVKEFTADWGTNYHKPGVTIEKGVKVRRFPVRKRDKAAFDAVNIKLMNSLMPLTDEEEQTFVQENVNSPEMYAYLHEHANEYDAFVYTPYMFGTTYYGIELCPEKAVLIPCLHEESYVHMRCFKRRFEQARGMIFLSQPEGDLAHRLYDLQGEKCAVLGTGVNEIPDASASRFRETYGIDDPFVLYAGRKDAGKNVDVLINYFCEYKRRQTTDIKLVLIGGGSVDVPSDQKDSVIDLGFLPVQDKYDAYRAATVLCQPSPHESFSLVIMESWLSHRPVIVSDRCDVTRNFAQQSQGGLYFDNYYEFEGALTYMIDHPKIADKMGENGYAYVRSHFMWDHVADAYLDYFRELAHHA